LSESSHSNSKRSVNRKDRYAAKKTIQHDGAAVPGPIKKNPIESVITTLPIIMLLGGLAFYFLNERRQLHGEILLEQIEEISGRFSGISQQSDKPGAQRILWIKTPSRLRGGRVDYQQAQLLEELGEGDPLTVWAAPKVHGSKTLWVVKASTGGRPLIEGTASVHSN